MVRHFSALALVAMSVRAEAADAPVPTTASTDSPRVEVIKIGYANANDIAELLSRILPPTYRVAAYGPTNSVVIATHQALGVSLAAPGSMRR